MSYDIIYNKQGIKLRRTGEVIIMLLSGPSNCFEVGRGGRNGRRTRDWHAHTYFNRKDKLSEKPEIILRNLERDLNRTIRRDRSSYEENPPTPKQIKERYGYYIAISVGGGTCGDTSWPDFYGVYANAIKKALTIEQLNELGVNPYFSAYTPGQPDLPEKPASVNIATEKQYFEERKKWEAWKEAANHGFFIAFSPVDTDVVLKRLKGTNGNRPARAKTRVEQDHFYVLESKEDRGYLVKYTARRFYYTIYERSAKHFRTEEEAEKYRKSLVDRRLYKAEVWKVKRVEGSMVFYV